MRNLLYIALLYVAMTLCATTDADLAKAAHAQESSVASRYDEQIACCHRCNMSAEQVQQVVTPTGSVRTLSHQSRQTSGDRTSESAQCGLSTHNYSIDCFVHRLSLGDRAVDFYLYRLCRLRI